MVAPSTLAAETIAHYDENAESFWEGTRDHDVSQNVDALLRHTGTDSPRDILDLGCGPGRDLMAFTKLGHRAVGLDASAAFVDLARRHSGCEVWNQNFLSLDLPTERFDGIFANAVLFHVPRSEIERVLEELRAALRDDGILFCSNPRGPDLEQVNGRRYGWYASEQTWTTLVRDAGFELLETYFRPPGRPRAHQPWLATVWRKTAFAGCAI